MQSSMIDASTIPLLEQVIRFSEARHSVLAGNIANLDTPNYRSRDLSVETFQKRLRELIEAQENQTISRSPGYIVDEPDAAMQRVRDSMKTILFHDGSDVGIEQQVLELSKNQFMHTLAISIMSSQFRLIESAISERA